MPTQDGTEPEWRDIALLLAARRCGALDALATDAGTAEEVAKTADIDPVAAGRLIAALEAAGFLTRVDGASEPTNRLLGFLTKTDLRSIGRMPGEVDAMEQWQALPETMAGEASPEPADAFRNTLGREAALGEARLRSEVTAAVHAAPNGDDIVVVGDGPGRRAIEFAERGWNVTLLDTADRIEAVEPLLEHEPVELRAGTPTDVPECDLVVYAGALHEYDAERARDIVASASEAATTAVFLDAFRGETAGAELVDIDLLAAGAGAIHDAAAVRSWLVDAFETVDIEPVVSSPLSAAIGRAIQ
ncbi:MAG: hypothetical protein ACI8UR_001747 [Natronomonas sp.]|jgi:hypothetical protein|uniref:SAM-dependent methyltransferase n=1 Tax=Natronomonas sp. TaxID=2184060 RepID=UPI0039E62AB4